MRKAGGVLTINGGIIGIVMAIWEVVDGYSYGHSLTAIQIVALLLAIVALIGGIFALRARVWGFALAGGIVVIGIGAVLIGGLPGLEALSGFWFLIIGILGTIFIALRKREFK